MANVDTHGHLHLLHLYLVSESRHDLHLEQGGRGPSQSGRSVSLHFSSTVIHDHRVLDKQRDPGPLHLHVGEVQSAGARPMAATSQQEVQPVAAVGQSIYTRHNDELPVASEERFGNEHRDVNWVRKSKRRTRLRYPIRAG